MWKVCGQEVYARGKREEMIVMSGSSWIWESTLGNWMYYSDTSVSQEDIDSGHVINTVAGYGPYSYYGPDFAPQDWLAEHPGWEPGYHPEVYVVSPDVGASNPGVWVWQPPTPDPISDNGHWVYGWVDDTPQNVARPGRPDDGHWEWQWVEGQP